ncbi:GyrI-like domain-containing protein [Cytobacillus firmus]|uniref:GyrI-like domain-containing protein n=1 Tax=Cytobacillus firmus TaxID=1399 RepID=UPI00202FCAC8|nr:GyrI-like domain-containing protein [Cytobacillus firmus]URT69239.1 GyrI-like domain-containing protein [Cytobacillus firmus]WHY60131.1 GyrI-like domain-containing protein [Cytobacillus firmus]
MSELILRASETERGSLRLIGIRVLCPPDQYLAEIPRAIKLFTERLTEIKGAVNPDRLVGAFKVEEDSPEEDGYWIGIEVKEFIGVPDGMFSLEIPPQKYASIRHNGPNDEIGNSYRELHSWIEEKGYNRLKNEWHLEIHHSWENIEDLDIELLDTIA